MTLIALVRQNDSIYCFSDTRFTTSTGDRRILDYFQKQFILNVHCTVGLSASAVKKRYKHKLGFAFAGASLLGGSLALLSNQVLENLHADRSRSPVTFSEILDAVHRVALLMHDQIVITHPKGSIYQAIIFGFCPAEKVAKFGEIYLDTHKQPYSVLVRELPSDNQRYHLFGTGRGAFEVAMEEKRSQNEPITLESVFRRAVASGIDPGTGGGIQVSVCTRADVSMLPVAMPTDGRSEPDVYLGGLNVTDFGSVGDYSIGRVIYGMDTRG